MRTALISASLALALVAAGCSTGSSKGTSDAAGTVTVVAAENFWGNLAVQLGGNHVRVRSIIANPDTDPHDYEATPADGRAVATASYVIYNGLGYDSWV